MRVCKNHIAHYKIPKYVVFVEDYPLTVTGKIQKFIIREQLE
jgi:acyl-CoA synthetase (AMP-forming)/AMP-acid ligase II